jgi:hypothetical protein
MALRNGLLRSSALQTDGFDAPVILQCRTLQVTNPKGHWWPNPFYKTIVFASYPVLVHPVLRFLEIRNPKLGVRLWGCFYHVAMDLGGMGSGPFRTHWGILRMDWGSIGMTADAKHEFL